MIISEGIKDVFVMNDLLISLFIDLNIIISFLKFFFVVISKI